MLVKCDVIKATCFGQLYFLSFDAGDDVVSFPGHTIFRSIQLNCYCRPLNKNMRVWRIEIEKKRSKRGL